MEDFQRKREERVLRGGVKVERLRVYQKGDVLYQLTYAFCQRFLPPYGDRTVDQMVQAARSGKQNIVEGVEDGKASSEMELRLLNVARASFSELREDFSDYLKSHHLTVWGPTHPRYEPMRRFAQQHSLTADYEGLLQRASDEELANLGLTLCHQVDTMLNRYMQLKEEDFRTQGGIKERMYRVRTGYRSQQDESLAALQTENATLREELERLRAENARLAAENAALRRKGCEGL